MRAGGYGVTPSGRELQEFVATDLSCRRNGLHSSTEMLWVQLVEAPRIAKGDSGGTLRPEHIACSLLHALGIEQKIKNVHD